MNLSNAHDFENSYRTSLAGPLYLQIQELLREKILSGKWRLDECLPNESELAKEYGVSLGTMRKALDLLGQSKLIVRRQGLGTFVSVASIDPAQRFSRLQTEIGDKLPASRRLSSAQLLQPSPEQANLMRVRLTSRLLKYVFVETAGSEYVSLNTFLMPADLFQILHGHSTKPDLVTPDDFLRAILSRVSQCHDKVGASSATAELAAILGVAENTPLLTLERVGHSTDRRVVFVSYEQTYLKKAYYAAVVQ